MKNLRRPIARRGVFEELPQWVKPVDEDYSGKEDRLCSTCQTINPIGLFQGQCNYWYTTSMIAHTTRGIDDLGLFGKIVDKSYCPFCRLMARALTVKRSRSKSHVAYSSQRDPQLDQCSLLVFNAGVTVYAKQQGYDPIDVFLNLVVNDWRTEVDPKTSRLVARGQLIGEDGAHVAVLRSWLDNCRNSHNASTGSIDCNNPPNKIVRKPRNLRLIDVHQHRIIKAPPDCDYTVLSYVWGATHMLQNTLKEHLELEKENALLTRADEVPRVIRDAMALTVSLGERYLWVDSLCIIQNDPVHKVGQITQMDAVYNNALLTIVAVSGKDANVSLPGLRQGSRTNHQIVEHIQDHQVAAKLSPIAPVLSKSYWSSRAWTYQEMLLSKRSLYFADEQVYFQCSRSRCCEDTAGEYSLDDLNPYNTTYSFNYLNPLAEGETRHVSFPHNAQNYETLVKRYTSRHLSYPSDIENAFSGIIGCLQQIYDWSFTECVSEDILDLALLWRPVGPAHRRSTLASGDSAENGSFPSWSWAGWIGPITYDVCGRSYFVKSEIESFEVENVNGFSMVKRKEQHEYGGQFLRYPEGKTAIAVQEPCNTLNQQNKVNTLRFFSQSARVRIRKQPAIVARDGADRNPPNIPDSHLVPYILDSDGRCCGIIFEVEPEWCSRNCDSTYEIVLLSSDRSKHYYGDGTVSMRCWAKRQDLDPDSSWNEGIEADRIWIYETAIYGAPNTAPQQKAHTDDYLYNVMLIRRSEDLVERLAIGQIHKDAWDKASPQREFFRVV